MYRYVSLFRLDISLCIAMCSYVSLCIVAIARQPMIAAKFCSCRICSTMAMIDRSPARAQKI